MSIGLIPDSVPTHAAPAVAEGGHGWQELKWLCDVNELLRARPRLDWAWVLDQARRMGCERMLLLALRLAQELLGASLPSALQPGFEAHPVVEALAASAREELFQEARGLSPAARRVRERAYLYHLRERRWDRAHYSLQLALAAMTPGEEERRLLRLPALLFPLYYLIRPFRHVGRYGRLLRRSAAE